MEVDFDSIKASHVPNLWLVHLEKIKIEKPAVTLVGPLAVRGLLQTRLPPVAPTAVDTSPVISLERIHFPDIPLKVGPATCGGEIFESTLKHSSKAATRTTTRFIVAFKPFKLQ